MGGCEKATLEMIYKEVKKINERIAKIEHCIIPEEQLSEKEALELDELVADAKKGNVTSFRELKK